MTAPKTLEVACPYCESKAGEPCCCRIDGRFQYYYSERDGFHAQRGEAARVRAAKEEK